MYKSAPEGYPFIGFFGLLTACAFLLGPVYSIIPASLTFFMLYFFRDPERDVPSEPDVFVSPADGRVIVAAEAVEERHLHTETKQISIFMSPFNVHVNRAPCDGIVKTVLHNKGRFMAAYRDEASIKNENIEMVLETRYGDLLVRQVAGFVARRAVCRKKVGDTLKRGERYGMIKFSSRLDVYLPKDAIIKVRNGDTVRAGETVLASLIRDEASKDDERRA